MKITGFESQLPRQHLANERAPADVPWHMAWRRALEQAQWEARARYQPMQAGHGQSPAGVADSGAQTQDLVRPRTFEAQKEAFAPLEQVLDANTVARAPVANAQQPMCTVAPVKVTAAPAPQIASPRPATPMRPDPLPPSTAAAIWGPWPEWLPRHMQMSVQGNRVFASVRDSDLDRARAEALFHRMHAQLQDWGLDLVELIVNGQRIAPDGASAAKHKEEHHGG